MGWGLLSLNSHMYQCQGSENTDFLIGFPREAGLAAVYG